MSRSHFKPGYKPAVGDQLLLVEEGRRVQDTPRLKYVKVATVRRKYFDIEALSGDDWVPHHVQSWEIERLIPEEQAKESSRCRGWSLWPSKAEYDRVKQERAVVVRAITAMNEAARQWNPDKVITYEQALAILAVLDPSSEPRQPEFMAASLGLVQTMLKEDPSLRKAPRHLARLAALHLVDAWGQGFVLGQFFIIEEAVASVTKPKE